MKVECESRIAMLEDPDAGRRLAFAAAVLTHRGAVGDEHLEIARTAGLDHVGMSQ
jgi:hypothetical protein